MSDSNTNSERTATTKGKSASELFPGLVQGKPKAEQTKTSPVKAASSNESKPTVSPLSNSLPVPPPPPDISWLKTGQFRESAKISDIPTVLAFVDNEKARPLISEAMQEFGYQVEYAESAKDAIQKTKQLTPGIIIFHTEIVNGAPAESAFHEYMKWLPMSKRRDIVYILVSAQSRTLYNLEALSYSANIVISDKDLPHLAIIIRKGLHEYRNLFGPYIEARQLHAQ